MTAHSHEIPLRILPRRLNTSLAVSIMSSPTQSGGAIVLGDKDNNHNDTSTAVTILPRAGTETLTQTLTKFHLFQYLPAELRIEIWEHAILSHHRDRLVPVFDPRKRQIICHPSLACSPHFSASVESRKVAKQLYPIELPVFLSVGTIVPGTPREGIPARRSVVYNRVNHSPGRIFLSFRHDIFAFRGFRPLMAPRGQAEFSYWQSELLSDADWQSIRRAMLYLVEPNVKGRPRPSRAPHACRSKPCCRYKSTSGTARSIIYNLSNVQFLLCAFNPHSSLRLPWLSIESMRRRESVRGWNEISHTNPSAHGKIMDLVNTNSLVCITRQELTDIKENVDRLWSLSERDSRRRWQSLWKRLPCTCKWQEGRLAYAE
ncbi:hypothetical protein F5Y18DRAFT_203880 [Xylariaceae sp. FL1019]|nr:hypothetical protein F5Y18DRAFT_203880 [Xylariaceae sp. FL1019]